VRTATAWEDRTLASPIRFRQSLGGVSQVVAEKLKTSICTLLLFVLMRRLDPGITLLENGH